MSTKSNSNVENERRPWWLVEHKRWFVGIAIAVAGITISVVLAINSSLPPTSEETGVATPTAVAEATEGTSDTAMRQTPSPSPASVPGPDEPPATVTSKSPEQIPILLNDVDGADWGPDGPYYRDELTIRSTTFPDSMIDSGENTFAEFALKGMCSKFVVHVGQDAQSEDDDTSGRFEVIIDGVPKVVVVRGFYDEPKKIRLDVTDKVRLRLESSLLGDGDAENVWGTPKIWCSQNPAPRN